MFYELIKLAYEVAEKTILNVEKKGQSAGKEW